MKYEGEISIIGTHDGKFHADEVMACAIVSLLFNCEIIRSRNENELNKADIIFDVAVNDFNKIFNHHDRNWKEFRQNGIPFASAGIAWQLFGNEILKSMNVENQICQNVFNRIDKIMTEIDAIDTGIKVDIKYGVTPIISTFMPIEENNLEKINIAFKEAVDFAKKYIQRQINTFAYLELYKYKAWEIMKNNTEIVVFDTANLGWRDCINEHWNETSNIKLIVYPDISGAWRVQSAPGENTMQGSNRFAIRCKAPEEWLGKNDIVENMNDTQFKIQFCHKLGFIGGAVTKDDAIRMAQTWIQRSK